MKRLVFLLEWALVMVMWSAAADAAVPRLLGPEAAVSVASERSQLERASGRLSSSLEVVVSNPGPAALEGPLHLAIDFTVTAGDAAKLTVDGAQGGIGKAPYQAYYVDLTPLLPQGGLAAGQTLTRVVGFSRPSSVRTTFAWRLFGVVNRAPLAAMAEVAAAQAGQAVAFDASAARDPDGDEVTCEWLFGDGGSGAGISVAHTYESPGVYDVVLNVNDGRGLSSSLTRALLVAPSGDYALARTRTLDADGVPLGGVTVDESGPAGALRTFASDEADGYAVLGGQAGFFRWNFHKPGYLPVWREATLLNGQLALVASPWLTALRVADVAVGPLNAVTVGGALDPVVVEFAAGTFSQRGMVGLTPLQAQALPLPLPVGWSPLAGIHLTGDGSLAQPGNALWQAVAPLAQGTVAAALRFEESAEGPRWRVHALVGTGATPACTLDRFGVFVLAAADSGSTAPPLPVLGAVPGAAPAGGGLVAVSAQARLDPSERPASRVAEDVKTTASVTFTAGTALASGRMFRTLVEETYRMRDGVSLRTPDYDTTFFAYQRPGDTDPKTLDARLPLRPSRLMDPVLLDEADVHVSVLEAADFAAAVVGPEGGVITQGQVRISAAAGMLGSRTVVELRGASFPASIQVPAGWDDVLAFQLGFAGGANRGLDIAISGVAPDAALVLARLVETGGLAGFEPVLRLRGAADGVARADEPAADPRLPGVTRGGTFVVLKVPARLGLVQGVACGLDAQPRTGLGGSIEGTPWLALTTEGGHFLLLAASGAGQALAVDPADGNRGQTGFDMGVLDPGVAVTVTLVPAGPTVVAVSPPAGALDVRTVEPVTLRFSEALDAASFGPDAVVLSKTGSSDAVLGALALGGGNLEATLLPVNPLDAGTDYTVTVAATLKDMQGLALAGERQFTFRTRAAENRGAGGQLTIYEPGAKAVPPAILQRLVGYSSAAGSGHVVAYGSPGTADPGVAVILINETSGVTATVTSRADGSFANFLAAAEEDFVTAVFINGNGTRISVPATRQLFDDGNVGLYRQGGILEAQSDGGPVKVTVEPDSIKNRSKLKVDVVPMVELLALLSGAAPENGVLLGGVRMTVSGEALALPAELSYPVAGASLGLGPDQRPEDGVYAACEKIDFDGQAVFAVADKMEYENGNLVTHSPPYFGLAIGAIGQILYIPIRIGFGPKLTLVGRAVSSPRTDLSEDEILAAASPVVGAVIHASRGVNPNVTRLVPGAFAARTNTAGYYVLLVPDDPLHPEPVLLRGFSMRFPGNVPSRVMVPTVPVPGQLPVFKANVVFPVAAGSNADTTPPVVTARPASAVLPTNLPREANVTFIARDDRSPPQISSITYDPSGSSSLVADSPLAADDVRLTQDAAVADDLTVTQIAHFAVSKAAIIAVKVVAMDGSGNQRESLFNLRFGSPLPSAGDDPPSSQPGEHVPPQVTTTWPASKLMLSDNQVAFFFSERIKRASAEDSTNITLVPAAVAVPTLSSDGCSLVVQFLGLKANTEYSVTLNNVGVEDLAGNYMASSYQYSFHTPPESALALTGLAQASGSIVVGSYLASIGSDQGGTLTLHRLGDSQNLAPVGTLRLPSRPRLITDLGRYAYRTTPNGPVLDHRLVAVAGGLVGSPDSGVVSYLWIVDVSDGANPLRVASSLVSLDSTQTVTIMRWDKPYLALTIGDANTCYQVNVNLQALILGSNGTTGVTYKRGTDLNGDGDYVDRGEIMPVPERNTLFGTEFTMPLAPGRFVINSDSAMAGSYCVTLMNALGRSPPRLQVVVGNGDFIGAGSDMDGAVEFPGEMPRRVLLEMRLPVSDDTGTKEIPAVLVAVGTRLEIYDLSDPVKPLLLRDARNHPRSLDLGSQAATISSILRGEGNEYMIAAGNGIYLLDRLTIGNLRSGAPPLRPTKIESDGGFVGRSSGDTPLAFGISSGPAKVINRAPLISVVSVPSRPVLAIDDLLGQGPAVIHDYLDKAVDASFIMPAIIPLTSEAGQWPPIEPADPLAHHYVRVRASGMLGRTFHMAAESLDMAGNRNAPMGKDYPPVILTDNAAALGLLGEVHPHVESIKLMRLSDDPDSDLYNEYLSSPIMFVRGKLKTEQLNKLADIAGRKLLWSGYFLRFGFDCTYAGVDRDLLPYLAHLEGEEFVSGLTRTYLALPAEYIDSPNPSTTERMGPLVSLVNLGSGEFNAPEVDYMLPGRHQDIVLQRIYQSRSRYIGPFGRGWDHSLNARVLEMPAAMGTGSKLPLVDLGDRTIDATPGDLIFIDGAGSVQMFREISADKDNLAKQPLYAEDPAVREFHLEVATYYESPVGVFCVFYKLKDGRFVCLSQTGHRSVFLPNGKLERIIGAFEKSQLVFTYRDDGLLDCVEGDRGLSLQFGYYFPFLSPRQTGLMDRTSEDPLKQGKIAHLQSSSSLGFELQVDYDYDTLGRLVKIAPNIGDPTILIWDSSDPDLLVSIGNADGTQMPQIKVSYDADGLVSETKVAGQTVVIPQGQAAATAKERFDQGTSKVSVQINGNDASFDLDRRGGVTQFANRSISSDDLTGLATTIATPEQPVHLVYDTENPVYRFRGNLLRSERGKPGQKLVSSTAFDNSAWNRPLRTVNPNGIATDYDYRLGGTDVWETTGALRREVRFNDYGQQEWEQQYNDGYLDFRHTYQLGFASADDGLATGSQFSRTSLMKRDTFARISEFGYDSGLLFDTAYNSDGQLESQTPRDSLAPITHYTYDFQKRLAAETYWDNLGREMHLDYTYSPLFPGKVQTLTHAESGLPVMETSYVYDNQSRLKTFTTGDETTVLTYDGTLIDSLRGPGISREVKYGDNSQVDKLTEQGIDTDFEYLNDGRVRAMTTRGTTTEFTYDDPANESDISERVQVKSIKDAAGTLLLEETYHYDAAGRLSSVDSKPSDRTRGFSYFADNSLKAVKIDDREVRNIVRDTDGFTRQITFNHLQLDFNTYDPGSAQATSETIKFLAGSHQPVSVGHEYDKLGRMVSSSPPNGRYEYHYDEFGHLTSRRDPDGVSLSQEFAPGGLPLRTIFSDGDEAQFEYNNLHRRTHIRSVAGNVDFLYDEEGLMRSIAYPDLTATTFGMRNENFAPQQVTSGGETQAHQYADGLLQSIDYETTRDHLGYTYDGLGRRSTVDFNGAAIGFGYHPGGALVAETTAAGTWSQDLGSLDCVQSETYPSGFKLEFSPDDYGQARSATAAGVTHISWAAPGLPAEIDYASGVKQLRSYDAAVRLTDIRWEAPGVDVNAPPVTAAGYHYELTSAGRVLAEQRLHQNEWDVFTRGLPRTGMRIETYQFGAEDKDGTNAKADLRDFRFVHGELETPITMSNADLTGTDPRGFFPALTRIDKRLDTAAGVPIRYNDDGAMSSFPIWVMLPGATRLTQVLVTGADYDGPGLLRRVERADGVVVSYVRDGLGRILEREVSGATSRCRPGKTRYLWQAQRLLEEYQADALGDFGLVRRYCYVGKDLVMVQIAASPAAPLVNYLPLVTLNGSIGGYLTEAGVLQETINYGAYGLPVISNTDLQVQVGSLIGPTLLFQGAWYDEASGLYQMGQRNLSPVLGQFLQRDEDLFVESLGWFNAFNGDPAGRVDPTGLASETAAAQQHDDWVAAAKDVRDPGQAGGDDPAKKEYRRAAQSVPDATIKTLELIASHSDGQLQMLAKVAAGGIGVLKKGAETYDTVQGLCNKPKVTEAIQSRVGPGLVSSVLRELVADGAATTAGDVAGGADVNGAKMGAARANPLAAGGVSDGKAEDVNSARDEKVIKLAKGVNAYGKTLREKFLAPDSLQGKKADIQLDLLAKGVEATVAGMAALSGKDVVGMKFAMSWRSPVTSVSSLMESGPRAAIQASYAFGHAAGEAGIMHLCDPLVGQAYQAAKKEFTDNGGWTMVAAGMLSCAGFDRTSLLVQRYIDLNVVGELTGALDRAKAEQARHIERREAYLNGLDAP